MIQVVVRALELLEYVAKKDNEPTTLTELAAATGLNQPTCANIVKTLVEKKYLDHVGRRKGYRLGIMAYQLTDNVAYNEHLVLAAKDYMEHLTAQLNETSLLGILRNNRRFLLHIVNSDQDLQVRSRTESDIYPTATGRILLAFLPEKERDALIEAIGLPTATVWPGIETREQLGQALAVIRGEELVITRSLKHIVGIAVPIRRGGEVVASLSVFLPESRYTAARRPVILQAVRETAGQINRRLAS
ncbi:IclR family transcriptional regulator [Larkinella sp. VNQ87]|uniref:IclR family transcriptional regulator n=1 Tax=Larkinella sp. VNQ87 TaxID=3400921 RepID=UPI003C064468